MYKLRTKVQLKFENWKLRIENYMFQPSFFHSFDT